jgi:hypothetical protein
MPRVVLRKANRGAVVHKSCSARICRASEAAGGPFIQPGQQYYSWSFRYGGTYYQHKGCGFPRPSQLTQSKISGVLAEVEAAEDALGLLTAEDAGMDPATILDPVAEAATSAAEEYRAAAEEMGSAGERWDSVADELEAWTEELQAFEPEDAWAEPDSNDKDAPSHEDAAQEWIDNLVDSVQELLGNVPTN